MRITLIAAGLAMTFSGVAVAQTAPAPVAAAATKYTTADTDLGTLLDNPASKAVLMKYIPQMVSSDQISMARSMTLKSLQQYAAEALTDETLGKIDADFAKLPARN